MRRFAIRGLVAVLLLAVAGIHAQDPTKPAAPEKEHAWLKQLAGEWEAESEMMMAPGQPPMKSKGTESVTMLGELWMIADIKGEMPGGAGMMGARLTLGYDPAKKKYIGTWIDSVMNHLWIYEGTLDATGKILTLETEGPNVMDPTKKAKYRDAIEIKSKDHKVLTSSALGDDGKWTTFMTTNYKRKK